MTHSHASLTDGGRVSDRAKRSRIVLRREVTKARRNEAECKRSVEARISTMLWEVMTVNHLVAELFSMKITTVEPSTGSQNKKPKQTHWLFVLNSSLGLEQ